MSNEKTQLPPELVEKMKHEIKSFDWKDITEYQAVDNCAQIAFDYRESEIAVLETDKAMLESELHSVKQQRDELLEALKLVKKELNPAGELMYKIEQLIQKYDGK